MIRLWWGIAATVLAASCAGAQPLQGGYYEGLLLGVSSSGAVTGYFARAQGQDVVKRCAFDLRGAGNREGSIVVRASSAGRPEPTLTGEIRATSHGVMLRLPKAETLPGCASVLPPSTDGSLELDLVRTGNWREIVRVSVPRARLRPQAAERAGKAYVVAGDALAVRGETGPWVQVDYLGPNGRVSSGWVARAEVAPLGPP